jgi:sugar lactone lactonase YvrE
MGLVFAVSFAEAQSGTYEAPLDARKNVAAKFARAPKAERKNGKVVIGFAVSAAIDVEVSVLDAKGKVIRHLAAGLLGKNPPAPLKKDSLEQELEWDLRDDYGKPASGGPFKVRVRLGLGAELDRFIPEEPAYGMGISKGASSIGVGPDGTLYWLCQESKSNGGHLFALDRDGKYKKTILPNPPGLKSEQVKGMERMKLADGSEVPMVYFAHGPDYAPFLSGNRIQRLEVTKDNRIVWVSGGSAAQDQLIPRHVLSINADGTAPSGVGFVGPRVGKCWRYANGLRQQQVALSPDGKTIYFAGMGKRSKKKVEGGHTIARMKWDSNNPEPFIGKPDTPGAGPDQLNDPRFVTTDAKGNIYVADYGNGRVAAFDSSGKPLGSTRVERPNMVSVHPNGQMYVLTKPTGGKRGKPWKPFSVLKFDKAIGGKEVARLDLKGSSPVLAMDPSGKTPRLWLKYGPGWRQPMKLVPIDDLGPKLRAGESVYKLRPFEAPLYIAADPARRRLYVGDWEMKVHKVELGSDKISKFLPVQEVAVDRDGNLYALHKFASRRVLRFDPGGKPLPFAATGKEYFEATYDNLGPHTGTRGLTVAPDGRIYMFTRNTHDENRKILGGKKPRGLITDYRTGGRVDVYTPDGKLARRGLVAGIPSLSGNGIAVDFKGNLCIGLNLHNPKKLYPDEFKGQVPELAWYTLYGKGSGWYALPMRGIPAAPWNRMHINFYLYHYGSVFKFGPEGGTVHWGGKPTAEGKHPRPKGVPADAPEYRVGYLKQVTWCSGAEWRYRGFGLNINRTERWGDPACGCNNSRFAMDGHARLFVPDYFRFHVAVLDSAGNEIARIGRYGNMDCRGKGSKYPEVEIPLAAPNAVALIGDECYIVDRKNRRIVAVNLKYAAEASCGIK